MVRVNKLQSVFCSDEKIFVKANDDERHLIKCDIDLSEYGDPKEARKELARQVHIKPPTLRPPSALGGASID